MSDSGNSEYHSIPFRVILWGESYCDTFNIWIKKIEWLRIWIYQNTSTHSYTSTRWHNYGMKQNERKVLQEDFKHKMQLIQARDTEL